MSENRNCPLCLTIGLGGTVETTGTGTEIKTGFCIKKMPYEKTVWYSRALNCEASSPIQLKFELH